MFASDKNMRDAQLKASQQAVGVGPKVPSYPTSNDGCDARAEPLIYQLRRNLDVSELEAKKQRRAVEILERHPEFEELIELLRLVPIW